MEANAWLALKARMGTFTETNTDVVYVGDGYSPIADRPYIFVQFVPTSYETMLIDPDCGEDFRGILNLSVFTPTSWGASAHLGLAQRVARHFTYGAKYTASGATVTIYQRPKIIGSIRLDGGHNRIEVQVAWRIWG